jgi:hypothetical protein
MQYFPSQSEDVEQCHQLRSGRKQRDPGTPIYCPEKSGQKWPSWKTCGQKAKPSTWKQGHAKLNYAQKHRNWGAEKWQQLLWTDESKFEVFGFSRRQFVNPRAGEWFTAVKHGRGSLQFWGCISANGVGDLINAGLLNAEK